jgi:hypothetical protein
MGDDNVKAVRRRIVAGPELELLQSDSGAKINLPIVSCVATGRAIAVARLLAGIFNGRKNRGTKTPRISVRISIAAWRVLALPIFAIPVHAHVSFGLVVASKPRKTKMIAGRLCDSDVSDKYYIVFMHGGLQLGLQGCEESGVIINLGQSGCSDGEYGERCGQHNE